MLVGSRVVRGPDWKFEEEEEDQDGGEGFVGTITSIQKFKDGSPLPKGTVLVYWDTGYQGCYRAGQNGCYDLRILDSAPSGIKFYWYICKGCKQAGIAGMRWQCAVCPNYNLCTLCYMNDIHDTNHRFVRFDVSNDRTNGVDVGQRSICSKIQAKGIFPAAIVKTGHDWTSEYLGNGIVLELASWEGIPRSAVKVEWDNFCELLLRVGHEGKVDLELVSSFSLGPFYYKDHLPTVSLDYKNNLRKQCSSSCEKQVQQHVESSVQSNQNADQKGELKQELIQRLQTCQQSNNTTSVKPPPRPPRTLPKPSPRSPRNNNSTNSNEVEQSEARQDQPTTAPTKKVKDLVKMMSQANMGDSGGRTPVKFKPPAPPKPANRVNPSDTTVKPSNTTRTARPPPPRPHSTIFAGYNNISPELQTKETKVAPPRMRVASLAASLDNLLQLDPSKSRMQTKKPPARDLICMSCDEKASKVVLDPCGHLVDVVCLGCARKLKRCFKCNEPINKKTTPDGSQLPESDEMDTSNNEKMKELERELAEAKRELECPICMDERSNVLFGCGHRTCMECSDLICQDNNQCPICKRFITERKRMF